MNYPADLLKRFLERLSKKSLSTRVQLVPQVLKRKRIMSLRYLNMKAKFITLKRLF